MTDWFQSAIPLADDWAQAMWRASWQGGLALALAAIVCRLVPRLSPRIKSWLWRLAYLKFLISLVWATPIDLPILPGHTVQFSVSTAMEPARNVSPAGVPEVEHGIRLNWPLIFLGLWFSGMVLVLGKIGDEWRAMKLMIAASRPLEDSKLHGLCRELAESLRLGRSPRIVIFDNLASPLVVGVWRPVIILPQRMLEEFSMAELRLTLAHELAHLRRGDLLWTWIPALVNGLFFFHPLVWLGRREWRLAQEMACDDAVLETTQIPARDYGEMLLKLLTLASGHETKGWLSAAMSESGATLKRRLDMLTHGRIASRPGQWLLVGVLAVVGLIPWKLAANSSTTDAIAWGEPVRGVQVGLQWVGAPAVFHVGETAEVSVQVRNVSHKEVRITYPSPMNWNATANPAGEVMLKPADSEGSVEKLATLIIAPGETKPFFDSNPVLCLQDHNWNGKASDFAFPVAKISPGRGRVVGEVTHPFMTLDGQPWPGKIETAALDFDLLPARATTLPGGETITFGKPSVMKIAWGPAVSGLQAGIAFAQPKDTYGPGEELRLDFCVRNVLDKPIAFTFRSLDESEWTPILTDGQGRTIRASANPETPGNLLGTVTLDPGERYIVGHPAFNPPVLPVRGGRYEIRCRLCQSGAMGRAGTLLPWKIDLTSDELDFDVSSARNLLANERP